MLVSVIISAYNEEKYLPNLFLDLKAQTYPHENIEVVLVNAMSSDKTKDMMLDFQQNNDFHNVVVVDNPRITQASGFNLGVKSASGDAMLKVDAHAHIPEDFIANNVRVMESGEDICGGKRPTVIETSDAFSKTLHAVEESMFGSSIANYRKSDSPRYVSSIFHGMYRREVFEQCGLNNEKLGRTEDNELHYRIRKNGYKIKYDPSILSYQYMRPTLSKMLKQKYGNGYWIGLTAHVEPGCLATYHFVPFLFVVAILLSLALIPFTTLPLSVLFAAYGFVVLGITLFTLITTKPFNPYNLLIPFLLFAVHLSYGWGTLIGLLKGFAWKKTYYTE